MKIQRIQDYVLGTFMISNNNTIYRLLANKKPDENMESKHIAVEGGAGVEDAKYLEMVSSEQFLICYPDTMVPMGRRELNVYRPVFGKRR